MDQQREQAAQIAHEFVVYQESECADEKEHSFDALWQSIYDMCKLIHFEIIDGFSEEEYQEAYKWLKQYQELTEDYQDFQMEF